MKQVPPQENRDARRARYFFYALGGVFTALALVIDFVPTLSQAAPAYAVRVCALIAIVLLAIGRFLPDKWVLRCEALLTGWP